MDGLKPSRTEGVYSHRNNVIINGVVTQEQGACHYRNNSLSNRRAWRAMPYVRMIFDVCILLSIHFVKGNALRGCWTQRAVTGTTGIILYPMGGHGVPCPYVRMIFDVCILLCIQFVERICLARLLTATGRHGGLPLPESFCIQWAGMACHALCENDF